MEMETKCDRCKKTLRIENFISEREKPYSKCHLCRAKLIKKRGNCQVCGIRATYNMEGETDGIFCKTHKEAGMIDVKHKTCHQEGCRKRPTYNLEGEKNGIFCVTHKEAGMVDVKNKTCNQEGCRKRPHYNLEGETTAKYCAAHKEAGMIDVKSKTCHQEGCRKRPCYNLEGETNSKYCATHKEAGMVNVTSKTCQQEGCRKIPAYNLEGETTAKYCAAHKEAGMIDVKSKTCHQEGCRVQARFNLPGMYSEYCTRHKKDGMILQPRKKCEEPDCNSIAQYGILTQIHCEEHKTKDDYNLAERTCRNSICAGNHPIDILDAFGHCVTFCSAVKQSEMYRKHQKKKEEFVGKLLEHDISTPLYMRDERGDNGCSASRPDFVYHIGTHVVIIEVDEGQHKSYNNCGTTKEEKQDTENRRMYNLSSEFDGLPLVFIRYNPDSYRVDGKVAKTPDQQRHDTLIRWVKKCIQHVPESGIWVKYLFYDDYMESNVLFKKITEEDFSPEDFI